MYLGVIDYEIEIEVYKEDKREAMTNIECQKLEGEVIKSKSERFFKRLATINQGRITSIDYV